MNLTEYNEICDRLTDFCVYVRRRAPYGDGELLERANKIEAELLTEYNAKGLNLLDDCENLQGNPAGLRKIERYRQDFAVYDAITALVDDLRSGAVSCPDNIKGWLILSLKGLVTLCSYLSQMCFAEFEKIREETVYHKNITFQELQEGKPEALEAFWGLLCSEEKNCLDTNHKWVPGCYQSYLAKIIQTIENQFPGSDRKGIAEFLGVKDYQVRNAKSYYPEK